MKNKKNIVALLYIIITISSIGARERIAILPFKAINIDTAIAEAVTETFITTIAATGNYEIIERAQLTNVINELNLTLSDDFEENTILEIGKLSKSNTIIIGSVVKLGSRFVVNFRGIDIESGTVIFGKNVACDSEDAMLDVVMDSAALIGNKNIEEATFVIDRNKGQKIQVPDYKFTDTFDTLNSNYWKKQKIDKDFTATCEGGILHWKADYRKGRLSSSSHFESQGFKADSFAIEIQFRDSLKSTRTIALFVGNNDVFKGNSLRVRVNKDKEYYQFSWNMNGKWEGNPEAVIPHLFGDEDSAFHTLKIVYDYSTKTAYGFIDNILIDSITGFSFIRIEKLYTQIFIYELASDHNKGVHVEFDNYQTTVLPK